LVGADREATAAALEANKLAQEALNNDRRQYALAIKAQWDAAMPAVVIKFAGTSMNQYFGQDASSMGIEPVHASEFRQMLIDTKASFEVTNYGPRPALLRVHARNEWNDENQNQRGPGAALSPPQLSPQELEKDSPFVLEPDPTGHAPKTVTATVVSPGEKVLNHMMGREYALLRFEWESYSAEGTFDWTSYALKLGSDCH
jgi:hypothetical protein